MKQNNQFDNLSSFRTNQQTEEGDILPKPEYAGAAGSFTATKNSQRNSAAMICAHVDQGTCFKNCCLRSGGFDGSNRHYYSRK